MDSQDDKKALFARRVQEALNVAGLTQKDIEDATGKQAAATVLRYVTGANLPRGDKLVELCTILKVTPNWLLGVDEWGLALVDPEPASPPAPTYADRLTAAVESLKGIVLGEGAAFNIWAHFHGLPGDERPLSEFAGDSQAIRLIGALAEEPDEQKRGIHRYELMKNDGLVVALDATDDLTVGEARYLARAIGFSGGFESPLAKSPDFYRWQLARLRASMAGDELPDAPTEVQKLLAKPRKRGQ